MRKLKFLNTLAVLIGLIWSFSSVAQVKNCNLSSINEELAKRKEAEQSIRKEVIPAVQEHNKTGKGILKVIRLANKMNKIDEDNQKYLDKLIGKCGWDDNLNAESHRTIFLIIDHGDKDFMNRYIDLVKVKAEAGVLESDDYPTVLDRKLMYDDKPQLFGTQTFSYIDDTGDNNYVWPIADPDNLKARRDSVGLPTMEEYFRIAMEEFNIKMVWDKSLTIEKALEMNN